MIPQEPEKPSADQTPQQEQPFNPEEYRQFITQLELSRVWLHESSVKNDVGPDSPLEAQVDIGQSYSWRECPRGFDAFAKYTARIRTPAAVAAEVDATFGLRFQSATPLNERIFVVFARVNLPVNAWPYFREFVSSTLGRLGWAPYTLPALKRGT